MPGRFAFWENLNKGTKNQQGLITNAPSTNTSVTSPSPRKAQTAYHAVKADPTATPHQRVEAARIDQAFPTTTAIYNNLCHILISHELHREKHHGFMKSDIFLIFFR